MQDFPAIGELSVEPIVIERRQQIVARRMKAQFETGLDEGCHPLTVQASASAAPGQAAELVRDGIALVRGKRLDRAAERVDGIRLPSCHRAEIRARKGAEVAR